MTEKLSAHVRNTSTMSVPINKPTHLICQHLPASQCTSHPERSAITTPKAVKA